MVRKITPGPSKLEKVVDPCSGPRGPLPEIGVHYLVLFSWEVQSLSPVVTFENRDLGSGPRVPGTTTFANFDGPGIESFVTNPKNESKNLIRIACDYS